MIWFQLDRLLHECSIFVVLIGCICPLFNRGVAVFSHVGPYYFPCFQEGHILLVFHLKYLFFFFVDIVRSCVSQMILSVVCTSNFFQAIFSTWSGSFSLHLAQVLSSTDFLVVSIFWSLKHLRGAGTYCSTLSRQ